MKVLHIIGGGDVGGAKIHVLTLIKELDNYLPVRLISLRPGDFADEAKDLGLDVDIVSSGNIIRDMRYVRTMVRDEDWNIVHCHGAKANLFGSFIKKSTGKIVITTVHSDYRLDYLHNILKMFSFGIINIVALRFVDYYIGVSGKFRQMLIERGFPRERIFTAYNGIPFDDYIPPCPRADFEKKYHLNIPEKDIVVGILARFHPVKDLPTLIKAAAIVLKKHPDVTFLIGGDGSERKNLVKLVHTLGIQDKVLFPGWFEGPFEFMQNIDINMLTSLSESFPFVILEGVRIKRATISSNVGGIGDLIEDGKNGYLFKPGDVDELADKLKRLVSDPDQRKTMGELIFEKASRHFSLKSMGRTHFDIYNKIANSAGAKSAKGYDIVISGYYGYNNSGDDAILKAMIDSFRSLKNDIRILVLSKSPIETKRTYHIDTVYRFNYPFILYHLRRSELLVMGGGSLLQDLTSTRSIIYYLGILNMARKQGLKIMLYSNGIGPINRSSNRGRVAECLNDIDMITLRDKISYEELDELGVTNTPIHVTADPAFLIRPCDRREAQEILKAEGIPEGRLIAVSVRDWYKEYHYKLSDFLDWVSMEYHLIPVLIPMQRTLDIPILQKISNKMNEQAYILRGNYTMEKIMGIIGITDIIMGMRLHSLIYAATMGVPIIGISYEQKVDAFLDFIGQNNIMSLSTMELFQMKDIFKNVWENRVEISKSLDKTITDLKNKSRLNTEIAINLLDGKNPMI